MTRTGLEWPSGQPTDQTGGVVSVQGTKVGSPRGPGGCLGEAWSPVGAGQAVST